MRWFSGGVIAVVGRGTVTTRSGKGGSNAEGECLIVIAPDVVASETSAVPAGVSPTALCASTS